MNRCVLLRGSKTPRQLAISRAAPIPCEVCRDLSLESGIEHRLYILISEPESAKFQNPKIWTGQTIKIKSCHRNWCSGGHGDWLSTANRRPKVAGLDMLQGRSLGNREGTSGKDIGVGKQRFL